MGALPAFWKSDLPALEGLCRDVRRGRVETIGASAGGRPVRCIGYGDPEPVASRANYGSACGAHDRNAYVDAGGRKPVVILVGGIHGQETEGVAALLNLIALMETGVDLAERENPPLLEAARSVRLLLVPVANPDGRARVTPDSMVGFQRKELEYWGQGTWKDGSLCKWPDCKKVHPIRDAVDFLGGYFNDDGVNLMHDQFFHPMAAETQALLDLAVREFADCILLLHGGSNSVNDLLPTAYVPLEVSQAIHRLATRCNLAAQEKGLAFNVREPPEREQGDTPPSFNLTSALHHACGAVCAVFESNECLIDQPGPHFTHEQIYLSHAILFEQTFRHFREHLRG